MGMSVRNMIDTIAGTADTIARTADTLAMDSSVKTMVVPLSGETLLQPQSFSGDPGFLVQNVSVAWHFYFLVSLLIIYAVARAFLGQLLNNTFNAAVRYNTAVAMYKDNSQLQRQLDTVLYGFYFVSMGFFMMLTARYFNLFPYGLRDAELFGFFTALIIVVFYLRIIIVNIVGHVFFSLKLFREYLYHGFIYNKLMGILALPLGIAMVYTTGKLHDTVVWTSLGIMGIMLIMKMYRGILFSQKNRVLNIYLFLYLCALEIVPMLLLYKWFTIIV